MNVSRPYTLALLLNYSILEPAYKLLYNNSNLFLFSVFIIPQRVILSIMGFLAIMNAYTMRITLSVAITEMVVKPYSNGTYDSAVCEASSDGSGEPIVSINFA